jgi:hypothetical protein
MKLDRKPLILAICSHHHHRGGSASPEAASTSQDEEEEEPMEYTGRRDDPIAVLSDSDDSAWSNGSSTVDLQVACFGGESDAFLCDSDVDYQPTCGEHRSTASSSAPRRSKRLRGEAAVCSECTEKYLRGAKTFGQY